MYDSLDIQLKCSLCRTFFVPPSHLDPDLSFLMQSKRCTNFEWFFTILTFFKGPFNEAASKNRQMLSEGSKTLSALQAGYFDPQFKRIFNGEAYSNPVQLRRRYRLAESKKNLGKAFLPSNGDKLP